MNTIEERDRDWSDTMITRPVSEWTALRTERDTLRTALAAAEERERKIREAWECWVNLQDILDSSFDYPPDPADEIAVARDMAYDDLVALLTPPTSDHA